jgi:hypothetical protein
MAFAECSTADLRIPGSGVPHRVVQSFLNNPMDADFVFGR